jgi:chaperonin GroES
MYQPVAEWVLVKRAEAPTEKSIGGILVPQSSVKAPERATVIAVGDKVEIKIKKGDVVVLKQFNGEDFELDGEKLTVVRYDEIKLVVVGK